MTVETGASGRIDIRATHFGPKGELLVNPTEVPKPSPPEKRGLLEGLLGRLRNKELPKQPEGPKHVLESIRKTGLADRLEKATQVFYKTKDNAYESDRDMHEETYGSANHPRIKLANIEEWRAERAEKTEEAPPAPIAEIPQPLNQIIENLNKAAGNSGEVSIGSLSLEHDSLEIITDRGIRINLRLPGIMSVHNEIYFSIDARSLGNNPELLQQIKAIEDQFSDQASLLGISEILIQYAEQVTSKLPEENDIRRQEVQEEKQRIIEARAERDRKKAENEGRQALEELRQRHPDNPLVNRSILTALGMPRDKEAVSERAESKDKFEVLSDRDQRYLDEATRNIMLRILDQFPAELPDAVILPDTSAVPLADLLRPVFAAIAQRRGLDKTPQLIPFKLLRKDEAYSTELDPEQESREIDEKTPKSRNYHKQKASEISGRLVAEHPDRKPSIIIIDDYANDETLTIKTIRNAFGRRDISAYPLLSSGENGGYDGVYEGLVDPYSAGAQIEQKMEAAAAGSEGVRASFSLELEDGGLDRNSQGFDFRGDRMKLMQQYVIENPDNDTSLTTEERANKIKELPQFSYQNNPGISHDMTLIGNRIAQDIKQAAQTNL